MKKPERPLAPPQRTSGSGPRPPRVRIDLRRSLSRRAQFALAAAVIAGVALVAWFTGRDDPVPDWITRVLVPLLGWAWLVLAGGALAVWVVRRLRGAKRRDG